MILPPPAAPAGLDFDERFVPQADPEPEYVHFYRYLAQPDLVRGRQGLDIASGEGCGGCYPAQTAAQVTGVDVAQKAVDHAARRYVRLNLRCSCGDYRVIPLPDASVGVMAHFHRQEHFTEHDVFLAELRRVLPQGGVLVISTPETDRHAGSQKPRP